jgi:tmRNA-binding protein
MSAEISVNRKALRDYHILERMEAGIELKGTEVKSIRAGLANVNNAFARIEGGQIFVHDVDISRTPARVTRSTSRSAFAVCSCIETRSIGSTG